MNNTKVIILFAACLLSSNIANALTKTGLKLGLTGVESNGLQLYVGSLQVAAPTCAYGGFYFKSGNATVQDSFLDVALKAIQMDRTVRIGYITQATGLPAPNAVRCVGQSIYIEPYIIP